MKIVQVLDEVSKKNISIVSVAKIISKYQFLSKQSKIFVTNNHDKVKSVSVLNGTIGNFFFHSQIYKFLRDEKPGIVHIHGIWRPIHFYFMINCSLLNIPMIIQPHGMLLTEALKNKTIVSFIFKQITLYVFYKIFLSKTAFIAVTDQEKVSIHKYFPMARVAIIKNPLILKKIKINDIKKQFIYFGRYNRHKNIKEFIEAFTSLNPPKDWTFNIYGIEDDIKYKKELLDLVRDTNSHRLIKFNKPIYNQKKKLEIISESSCNVLLSKSEILSLSALEASSVGTPSIVNKEIFFPQWLKKHFIISSVNKSNLQFKIKSIINKKVKDKRIKKKELKKIFLEKYKSDVQSENYKKFINKTYNSNKKDNLYSSVYGLTANLLNSILIPFLIITSVIFKSDSFAADIGLYPGIILLLTQVFSANARSLLLYNKGIKSYDLAINTRIYIGFLLFILITGYQYFFNYNVNFYAMLILSLIVYFSWINEINLSLHEKNKSTILLKFFLLGSSVFYLFLVKDIVSNGEHFIKIIEFYLLFQFVYYLYHVNIKNIKIEKVIFNFNAQIDSSLSLASSFFNIVGVILWRISLVVFFGKSIAGLYFAAFAIASFPGTLFNNIIGQIVVINKNIKSYIIKSYKIALTLYYLAIPILLILNNMKVFYSNFYNFFNITLTSLLATPIMLYALFNRHQSLSTSNILQKKIFFTDIVYGLSISPIILILYYAGGEGFVVYSYLASSIVALLYYGKRK